MPLDEEQILQTLMQSRGRISAAAWVVVRDTHTSEDIFQNVALKALTKKVSFETDAALKSWAFITARREGIDWLRKHKHEASCLDDSILEILESEWSHERPLESGPRFDALRECVNSVPAKSRELLKLRYYDGYSCEEVAQRMGAGLNAIYKRVSRLHHSLKDCVESRVQRAQEAT